MKTYIITMDMENELSEAAASALNGHFFTCPQIIRQFGIRYRIICPIKAFHTVLPKMSLKRSSISRKTSIRKIGRPKTLTCSRRLYR